MEDQPKERVQVRCPICASESDLPLVFVNGFRIARCSSCEFVFVNPRPTEETLSKIYSRHDKGPHDSLEETHEPTELEAPILLSIVRQIHKYVPSGRLLEIGCGRGDLLRIAQSHGFSVTGCDMFGTKMPVLEGAALYDGTLKQARLPNSHFDVVVIRDVLEHLFDPNEEIKEIRRVLKPKGYLYIKVPNVHFEQGLLAKLLFGSYYGFWPPYHLNHFSPRTFKRFLKNAQFDFLCWYLEQPTPNPRRLFNIFMQTGYRFIQTLYFFTQRRLFPKVVLACWTQKPA